MSSRGLICGEERTRAEDMFCRGWLQRKTGLRKNSIFASLKACRFQVLDQPFDSKVLEEFDARGCELSVNKSKVMFTVKAVNNRILTFYADTSTELGKWVAALTILSKWRPTDRFEIKDKQKLSGAVSVYNAFDKNTGKEVMVKALVKTKVPEEQLAREKEIMKTVKNDNIVDCVDIFESSDSVFIVQGTARGGSLASFLMSRPGNRVSDKSARILMYHILSALRYLHSQGIAHRNIKPENILLDVNSKGKFQPKLTEFSKSQIGTDTLQTMHTKVGSVHFVAPEVVNSKAYDQQCDLWACGILTYLLVVGDYPFHVDQASKIKRAHAGFSAKEIDNPNVTPKCRRFLEKMLMHDPQKRYTIDEAIKDPWITNR